MSKLRHIIATTCLLFANTLSVKATVPDSAGVIVREQDSTLCIQVSVYKIETQLTFLMQGLTIFIEQPDTIRLSFPSASMVRDKVRRHPNEVKAQLETLRNQKEVGRDSINHVVRPDVQPLVAALNDTTATVSNRNKTTMTPDFHIAVDRKHAIMVFTIAIRKDWLTETTDSVQLRIYSCPPFSGDRQEFVGKRLSGEHSPQPQGLGEGIRKVDAPKRTYNQTVITQISKASEQ